MSSKTFITSYDSEISYIDDYREIHPSLSSDDIFTQEKPDQMDFGEFLKDLFEYGMVMDILDSMGIEREWESALDIGGSTGTISRLLKADDVVDHATCIDVRDVQSRLPTSRFNRFMKQFKIKADVGRYIPQIRDRTVHDYARNFGYYPLDSSTVWNVDMTSDPTVDDYIVGDAVEYDFQRDFDLISAFLCLEYFNIDDIFEQVASNLTDGGIFCFLVNYWWWPVNSTAIVGDFPYACQRLTRDDLERYLEDEHPDEVDDVLNRYDYFHNGEHPTIDDYIERAAEQGLSLIGTRRFIPSEEYHPKTPVPPAVISEYEQGYLKEVLNDIHAFNNTVRLSDLKTAFVMGVFEKDTDTDTSLSDSPVFQDLT